MEKPTFFLTSSKMPSKFSRAEVNGLLAASERM